MASASIKRQRKRKRADQDGDPEFQVAPMVDVLLVLLLFFMAITSTEVLKKDPNLKLAEAKHGKKPDKSPDEVVANIAWDGVTSTAKFNMNGVTYLTADEMTAPLADRVKQDPATYVLIRADKDVEYSNVADLMNACAGAGIGVVSFSVVTGAGNKPGAAPAPAAP